MQNAHLSLAAQIRRVKNAVAVGTSTQTSDTVDTQGYDGVAFVAILGAITDGTPSLKIRQGAAADMSDGADLAGTAVTIAATDDNKLIITDVIRPAERYVDCQLVRGGATGAVVDGILAILYRAKALPISQHSTVAGNEQHTTPAEGTA